MLHAQRVNGFELDPPGNDRRTAAVPLDDTDEKRGTSLQQPPVLIRPDQGAFAQRRTELVRRHEELRVAEVLDRADAQDDLLARPLRGIELPVELTGPERAGPGSIRSQ